METSVDTTIEKEGQIKHYKVDARRISPLRRAGGNPRNDYGNLEELAADILQNGIVTPMRGFRTTKDEEFDWEITAGHRRLAACKLLAERGNFIMVPIISIGDSRLITDEMILIEHMTTNSGKEFNPVEQAETIRRLMAIGWKTKKIAERLGKSMRLIQNLALLAGAPMRIRNMVSDKTISYTLVLDILKESSDYNEVILKIENALGHAKSSKKPVSKNDIEDVEETFDVSEETHTKITKRHIDQITNKVDSFKELQMVFKRHIDKQQIVMNTELFTFAKRIVENKLTASDIEKYFY